MPSEPLPGSLVRSVLAAWRDGFLKCLKMWDPRSSLNLLGGIPTPLKNMRSSVGMMIPYIMETYGNIKNVWNHQPVMHAVMPISLSAYILILLISVHVRGVHDRDYSLLPREFCETWQCQRPSLSSSINLEQSFAHKLEFIIMINWLMDRCAWNHYQYSLLRYV